MEQQHNCYNDILDEAPQFSLLEAASVGDSRMVQQLLASRNCDANMMNSSGWTAAMFSAFYGHYKLLRVLADAGADFDIRQPTSGRTALMMASMNGHTRCIEVLLTLGNATKDLQDIDGKDAASHASASGHGNNMIISKLLDIKEKRSPGRAIASARSSMKVDIPQIVVASPTWTSASQLNRAQSVSASSQLKVTAPSFTPRCQTPDADLPAGATSYLSPFHYPECFQHISKSPSRTVASGGSGTDAIASLWRTPVDNQNGAGRKRKLFGSPSNGDHSGQAFSASNSPSIASSSSDAEHSCSQNNILSPPLPSNLERLLARIELSIYKEAFEINGIDLWTFLGLSEMNLKELGITLFGHRRKLVLAQTRYRESVEIVPPQESFFADYLIVQTQELEGENGRLKDKIAEQDETIRHLVGKIKQLQKQLQQSNVMEKRG